MLFDIVVSAFLAAEITPLSVYLERCPAELTQTLLSFSEIWVIVIELKPFILTAIIAVADDFSDTVIFAPFNLFAHRHSPFLLDTNFLFIFAPLHIEFATIERNFYGVACLLRTPLSVQPVLQCSRFWSLAYTCVSSAKSFLTLWIVT